jgi:REP element-mobilizing transposase RayT
MRLQVVQGVECAPYLFLVMQLLDADGRCFHARFEYPGWRALREEIADAVVRENARKRRHQDSAFLRFYAHRQFVAEKARGAFVHPGQPQMLTERGRHFNIELIERNDARDVLGAREVADRVDDVDSIVEVGHEVDAIDRIVRPGRFLERIDREQEGARAEGAAFPQEVVTFVEAGEREDGGHGQGSGFHLLKSTHPDIPLPHAEKQCPPMARRLRPYFPGGVFHVTARTHGGHPWFDEAMRDFVCDCLATVQRRVDARLFAFTIMPNHLHLVLQQGDHPLGRFMQPLLTRVAMAVRKKYDLIGHVFGTRYWSHPCVTQDYLEACIGYVHRNPVKAGLCGVATEYRWSSAAFYAEGSAPRSVIVEPALQLAAAQLIGPFVDPTTARPLQSLERVVLSAINEFDVDIELDVLRGMRCKLASMIRARCIRRAVEAGYRNFQIARYLCVGDATVSRVAVRVRGEGRLLPACLHEPKRNVGKQTPKKIGQPKLPYSRD